MSVGSASLSLIALRGIPEVVPGSNLAVIIAESLKTSELTPRAGDVLVVAQKIVSKAEGRFVDLTSIAPGPRARELAAITRKDARLVELILAESTEILRAQPDVLIVRHRLGFVMANAGIDRSNVGAATGFEPVLLLPHDPDASAAALRSALAERYETALGVIISDSFGRPWRKGIVNVALGAAGVPTLVNRRGDADRAGRRLEVTEVAIGDALAAAAGLVMGEASESMPAVLIRGLELSAPACTARALIRPLNEDLFR
jgi:coenzyme F420-0:L-glutamate ligase / coenzyme F420-1:gamma-L-glutamate ligase